MSAMPVAEIPLRWHPRLGYSTSKKYKRVVHVVDKAWTAVFNSFDHSTRARWECGGTQWSGPVDLVGEIPEGDEYVACSRCDVYQIQTEPSVVYLVDLGDMVKVGTTASLTVRVAALKGELIAWVQGSYDEETAVIESLPKRLNVQGREHFAPSAVPLVLRSMQAIGKVRVPTEVAA